MISLFLYLLAGILNALMDTFKDHWHWSIFNRPKTLRYWWWLNESIAWTNKHEHPILKKWYIPVAFTSAWHLSKSLMLWSLSIASAIQMIENNNANIFLSLFLNYNYWLFLGIYTILFRSFLGCGFVAFYNYLLLKK